MHAKTSLLSDMLAYTTDIVDNLPLLLSPFFRSTFEADNPSEKSAIIRCCTSINCLYKLPRWFLFLGVAKDATCIFASNSTRHLMFTIPIWGLYHTDMCSYSTCMQPANSSNTEASRWTICFVVRLENKTSLRNSSPCSVSPCESEEKKNWYFR